MGLYMQGFFKTPAPPNTYHSQNASYYFSDFEESYQGKLILISARLRLLHKEATDRDLWLLCFGGLRLDRFEVTRHGLRVEIIARMRDIKEIREDIEEDKKKGIRI